jgi:SAM-dependent methyltransferase
VLIVGAGTGNDVAAALRAGVGEVVAVDIDPAIVRLGETLHPEQPYADPRVRIEIDDARRVLRTSAADSYDAVVFGLLDSHTQLAGSSVRLDNYVFTQESLRDAWRVLRPGGAVVLTAACFDQWFVDRFDGMLRGAFGADHVLAHPPNAEAWWQWTATKASASPPGAIVPDQPSDDWPFLYLPERSVPRAYLVVIAALVIASLGFVRAARLERSRLDAYHAHMFFLGAAFLLMETYAVNRLALLFGTTWLVSAVTIVLALVLVLLANLVSGHLARVPVGVAYGGIALGVIGTSLVAPTALVGAGATNVLYGLLVLSPVFFAGFVFSRSFARATNAGAALGANIVGSVLGGWTEYATMALGIQAMAWVALGFYACSAVCLVAGRPRASEEEADAPHSHRAVG